MLIPPVRYTNILLMLCFFVECRNFLQIREMNTPLNDLENLWGGDRRTTWIMAYFEFVNNVAKHDALYFAKAAWNLGIAKQACQLINRKIWVWDVFFTYAYDLFVIADDASMVEVLLYAFISGWAMSYVFTSIFVLPINRMYCVRFRINSEKTHTAWKCTVVVI